MNPLYRSWLASRALLFYVGYVLSVVWFSTSAVTLFRPCSSEFKLRYILYWNRFTLWWLKVTCGVSYRLHGAENIPNSPYVVLSKHQSQWETFYLQLLFYPLSSVLKKELLSLPFFGWGLSQTQPIAIDRGNPKAALRQVREDGLVRLQEQGRNVLIFPEGTRIAAGERGRYARSGADLAVAAGVPVVPVAHNAGTYWPAHQMIKYPGIIEIHIGPAIEVEGRTSREITEATEAWIEATQTNLPSKP